jgi:O-glycosyl hydrolase
MQYSTIANTDQKMDLIVSDFFSEFTAKNTSTRVTIKEKLNATEKNQFNTLINDSKNLKLLNIMSNICYKKINRDQKGLGVFMDILFRSCEQ